MWRRGRASPDPDVLLAHMGGPFWASKDEGAWSIPKGLADAGEASATAAVREFTEETGLTFPGAIAELVPLGEFRQSSKKTVVAWAFDATGVDDAAFGP